MSNLYIGIDPGVDGGLAVLSRSGYAEAWFTPSLMIKRKRVFDEQGARSLLQRLKTQKAVCAIETTYRAAKASENIGIWKGLLVAIGIIYTPVHPNTWQSDLGIYGTGSKDASMNRALTKFPHVNLTTRSGMRIHDGKADAINIAHWGMMNGES